jgi:hypothetical protein
MKTFTTYIVLITFFGNTAFAEEQVDLVIDGGLSCSAEFEEEEKPEEACETNPDGLKSLTTSLGDVIPANYQYPACNENDFKTHGANSAKQISTLKANLKAECEQEFREQRNQLSKDLLKKFRLGAALRVRMMRAKKFAHSGVSKSYLEDKSGDVSDFDFNKAVEEWKTEADEDFAAHHDVSEKKVQKKWSMNYNDYGDPIVLFQGADQTCQIVDGSMKTNNFVAPPVLNYPAMEDMKGEFPDDCSVLVSNKSNFEKSRTHLSQYSKTQQVCDMDQRLADPAKYPLGGFRKPELDAGDKAFAKLDTLAGQFISASDLNYKPSFTINVSRNQWADDTDELAKKRGEFSRSYLLSAIQEKCTAAGKPIPEWAKDMKAFEQVVKVNELTYGDNKKGDYGPNPKAKLAEQEKEIQEYEAQLRSEKASFEKDLQTEKESITSLKTQKTEKDNRIVAVRNEFNKLKKSKIFDEATQSKMNELSAELKELYSASGMLDYQIQNSQKKENYLTNQVKIYTPVKDKKTGKVTNDYITNQTNLLKQFYATDLSAVDPKDEKLFAKYTKGSTEYNQAVFMHNKHKWDAKLFNSFKKVEVVGDFSPNLESDTDMEFEFLPPEMQKVIRAKAEAYQPFCQFYVHKRFKKNKDNNTSYDSGVTKGQMRRSEKRQKKEGYKPCKVSRRKQRQTERWMNNR